MAAAIIEQDQAQEADQLPANGGMSPEQLVEDLQGQDTTQQAAEPQADENDDIPEKYRGKSIKDVVAMHQEAERLMGRQGSEVGELRKVVDQFIMSQGQASQDTSSDEPALTDEDYFSNPTEAISKAISSHPEVKAARETAQTLQRTQSLQALQAKHPDAGQVIYTQGFVDWVKASPIRQELFARADTQYDYAAADELISSYKERTKVVSDTAQAESEQRRQQVQKASTGSAAASTNSGSKKVYRRADIIKLMKTDPARYEQLSPEIMQAYAEGRVR